VKEVEGYGDVFSALALHRHPSIDVFECTEWEGENEEWNKEKRVKKAIYPIFPETGTITPRFDSAC